MIKPSKCFCEFSHFYEFFEKRAGWKRFQQKSRSFKTRMKNSSNWVKFFHTLHKIRLMDLITDWAQLNQSRVGSLEWVKKDWHLRLTGPATQTHAVDHVHTQSLGANKSCRCGTYTYTMELMMITMARRPLKEGITRARGIRIMDTPAYAWVAPLRKSSRRTPAT